MSRYSVHPMEQNYVDYENKKRREGMERAVKANEIAACGCRFESDKSNTVILCEKCSQLPCHNP